MKARSRVRIHRRLHFIETFPQGVPLLLNLVSFNYARIMALISPDLVEPLLGYLFSPRKSPPTPIGHLGEGAHKIPIYDSTLLSIILHHHIREFH
jgi:hypothetical protein